jgi:hypothetical protein
MSGGWGERRRRFVWGVVVCFVLGFVRYPLSRHFFHFADMRLTRHCFLFIILAMTKPKIDIIDLTTNSDDDSSLVQASSLDNSWTMMSSTSSEPPTPPPARGSGTRSISMTSSSMLALATERSSTRAGRSSTVGSTTNVSHALPVTLIATTPPPQLTPSMWHPSQLSEFTEKDNLLLPDL